jgi:hypothetical protein
MALIKEYGDSTVEYGSALYPYNGECDVNITLSALTLNLTLNTPTYRSDVSIPVTALTLTLSLKDWLTTISSSITSTAGALNLSLWAPTIQIDSTVSPATLTLTGTLIDGTPFLATRHIRRDYTFGITEQVTATKLNNLADTAIWEISNQVAGDLFYYEGTDPDPWKRIAKGTNGQVLTINASGVPRWA